MTPSAARLTGFGPSECSTSTVLALSPEWIADVNGYYRDLGVSPFATRGQIARAYQARGLNDPHLTYVVKQLLNPVTRRAYDLTPLGHVFLDDEVADRLNRILRERLSEVGRTIHDELFEESYTDLLRVVDKQVSRGNDSPQAVAGWSYSYYLWGTDRADARLLQDWQDALIRALAGLGGMKIAVGVMGGMHSEVEAHRIGSQTVYFIHEQSSVTDALAQRAVSQLYSYTFEKRDRKMSQESAPSFRRGTDEAKEGSKGASFARTHYFGLDADPTSKDNSVVLRFLTEHDDLLVVDQHNNVPTKGAPSDFEGQNWPSRMSAICRRDRAFGGMYDDCYICDHIVGTNGVKRASARSWAYAVLREEVREDGVVVGIRDQTREVAETDEKGKPTGDSHLEKAIVVVNMGYKNFFAIVEGFGKHFDTLLDRDYVIKRNGSGTDTTYSVIPLDPIQMEDGERFDLRNPEYADRYQPAETIEEIVIGRSEDEFYARFFDTRVEAPKTSLDNRTKGKGDTADAPERPSGDGDGDRMAALADRVKTYAEPDAKADDAKPAKDRPKAKSGGMRNFG